MIEEDNLGSDPFSLANAPQTEDSGGNVGGDILKAQDNATSFFSASDVLMSVPRGVVGAAKGAYNLADILTFDLLPDWENNPLGASTSTVGSVVEVISEFAVGFLTGSAAISAASKATKLGKVAKAAKWLQGSSVKQQMAKGAVAGGFADLTVFEGDEMRLSNLIESVPGLGNPITEFLATKEDDVDSLTGRLKNVLEGGLVGTVAEGVIRGLAKGVAASADIVKKLRAAAQEGKSVDELLTIRDDLVKQHAEDLEGASKAAEQIEEAVAAKQVDETPAAAQADPAVEVGTARDVNQPLTKEQLDTLDPSIPRNPDGSVDEEAFRRLLGTLREDRKVNLLRMADEDFNGAVMAYDALKKTGKMPDTPPTITRREQLESVVDEVQSLENKTASELAELLKQEQKGSLAVQTSIRLRLEREIASLQDAFNRGAPKEQTEALKESIAVWVNLDKQAGSGASRLLQIRDTGLLERLFADPTNKKVAEELVDSLGVAAIHPNTAPYGSISDKISKITKTGLDIMLELFRNSILSGPRTTAVNVSGNVAGMMAFQGERAAGAWVASKILGRSSAKDIDLLASKEGRVLVGYLDQLGDLFGMLVGRTPKGPTSATGKPLALTNAAESWRREGSGVTLADQAWSEGVEMRRGISAQRLGLGGARMDAAGKPVLDSMGRPIFDPTPAGHIINTLGAVVNLPMRVLGATDEAVSTMISRTNAREMVRQQLGKRAASMTADEVENHLNSVMKQMFDETGRLYGRKTVEERAIRQTLSEGLNPNETLGKARVLDLVQNGDAKIGFEPFDPSIDGLARQVEARVREATWKTELSDIANDPLRGFGTKFVANLGKSASTLVRNVPAAGLILPFIRTPTNLITWALNRNPASLVWKGIQNEWYKANPEKQAELMGRLMTGVGFYSFATGLAAMGTLTGRGPRDPALRQQLRESGWQPYSIKVGDTYVSYARADPFSTIIGFVADLADAAHKVETGEIDGLTDIAASIVGVSTSVITDKTFVAGLTAMLNAVTRPDLYGEQLIKQYASAVVPNFFAQSLTPFSEELERSRSALDAIMMRIPGWGDDTVDKVRNPLGEPVLREKGPLGNVTDPINPFSISTVKNDPLNQEFIRLGRAISSPRRTLNGGIDLWDFRNSKGQSAYDRYQELTSEVRIGSKDLRSSLLSMIGQRRYQALPDADVEGMESPRAGLLRSEIGRYRRKAFSRLLEEFPDLARRYQEVKSRGG